jgi:hypothetical protein
MSGYAGIRKGRSKVWFEYMNPYTRKVTKVGSVKEGAKIAHKELTQNMWVRTSRARSS